MTSVGDVKGALSGALQGADEALAMLAAMDEKITEVMQATAAVADGTGHEALKEAAAMLLAAGAGAGDVRGSLAAYTEHVNNYMSAI